jgi:hypothetical protein
MLLEFQRINKQKAAKRNVDYFQRVCDATFMHAIHSSEGIEKTYKYVEIVPGLTPNKTALILNPIKSELPVFLSVNSTFL